MAPSLQMPQAGISRLFGSQQGIGEGVALACVSRYWTHTTSHGSSVCLVRMQCHGACAEMVQYVYVCMQQANQMVP